MDKISILLIIGSAIIISLAAGKIGKNLRLPMVIGYVLIGVILGRSFLNILTPQVIEKMSIINDLALGIIAFIIGGELKFSRLKQVGKVIISIATFECLGAFFMVALLTYFFTRKIYLGLILGAVASATAPAATVAVINQYKARGPLTTTILGVVGSDDAFALIIYAFASSISYHLIAHTSLPVLSLVLTPAKEIFFSLLIGAVMGIILSYFLRKMRTREEAFALTIGIIILAEGIAVQFNFSELLLVMVMAITGSNLTRKFDPVMNTINILGFPLIATFFCLAGTRLDIKLFPQIGLLGLLYLVARMSGKYVGASLGAALASAPSIIKKYIGLSLWPQIGVAVALAITVERDFASFGKIGHNLATVTMNILLFTTIFTEIIGPLATRFALTKAEEIKRLH